MMAGHLQMTFGIEEQIFGFNVPVSHTLTMKIGDSVEYLLKTALGLARAHASIKGALDAVHERNGKEKERTN